MPDDESYTITELADLAGVTTRTVRYYIAQGLLPSTGQSGPGTRYSESHLARLRLIRSLQAKHLPLAEIRRQLDTLDDEEIVSLAAQDPPPRPSDSALDYIRAVLGGTPNAPTSTRPAHAPEQMPSTIAAGPHVLRRASMSIEAAASAPAPTPAERLGESHLSPPKTGDRSQWERIVLATDVELHIRRPLSRTQNKRVDRLVTVARELLEDDPS